MAHTRTVFHTVHRPDGSVWEDFTVHFKLSPSAYTMHATLPESVVTATTNSAGYFEVDLETGVEIIVDMYSAFQIEGTTVKYGNRNIIKIVVPHGTAPIDLPTVMALQTEPDGDPDLAALANNHIGRKDNPHEVTAAQVGAYTTGEVDLLVSGVTGDLTAHTTDTTNPHEVTAAQVGLGNVANLAPADLPVSTATQDALDLKADGSALSAHTADVANPHGVTKAQVGLSAVDNTSDADKPLSTATSNALALKADISSLGTAAAADVGDFATAAQGAKADTAVQPSADLTDAIDQRHDHVNKAVLDTVTPELLVPGGGVTGQVLTPDGWSPDQTGAFPLGRPYQVISPASHGLGAMSWSAQDIPAGKLILVPMYIPRRVRVHQIQMRNTTATVAGSIRMGIFSCDGTLSTNLLIDIGVASTTTVSNKIISVGTPAFWLDPGWVFLGCLANETVSVFKYVPSTVLEIQNIGFIDAHRFAMAVADQPDAPFAASYSELTWETTSGGNKIPHIAIQVAT